MFKFIVVFYKTLPQTTPQLPLYIYSLVKTEYDKKQYGRQFMMITSFTGVSCNEN